MMLMENAFTSGLLHDVGKILLGTFMEVDVEPIVHLAKTELISFNVAEQRVLGIDHAEAGAALLEAWELPELIIRAIRWHHTPEDYEGDPLVVDLVHVADALCLQGAIGAAGIRAMVEGEGLENNAFAIAHVFADGSLFIEGFGRQESVRLARS